MHNYCNNVPSAQQAQFRLTAVLGSR